MAANIEKILEEIGSMTILEVSELVSAMEEKFGVTAAAPVAVASAAVAGGEAAEEQSEFNVVLASIDDSKKIAVIKVVREITGLGLKEAKEIAETAGSVVKEGASKEDATSMKEKLEGAGAKVELK